MDSQNNGLNKIWSNPLYPLLQITLLVFIWVLEYVGLLSGDELFVRYILLMVLFLLIGRLAWAQQPAWLVMLIALLGLAGTFFDSFMGWVGLSGSGNASIFMLLYGAPITSLLYLLVIVWSCFLRRKDAPE